MGEKIMEGFPTREEALADFFAAWEPVGGEELVTLDEAAWTTCAPTPATTSPTTSTPSS